MHFQVITIHGTALTTFIPDLRSHSITDGTTGGLGLGIHLGDIMTLGITTLGIHTIMDMTIGIHTTIMEEDIFTLPDMVIHIIHQKQPLMLQTSLHVFRTEDHQLELLLPNKPTEQTEQQILQDMQRPAEPKNVLLLQNQQL